MERMTEREKALTIPISLFRKWTGLFFNHIKSKCVCVCVSVRACVCKRTDAEETRDHRVVKSGSGCQPRNR